MLEVNDRIEALEAQVSALTDALLLVFAIQPQILDEKVLTFYKHGQNNPIVVLAAYEAVEAKMEEITKIEEANTELKGRYLKRREELGEQLRNDIP